MTTNGIIHIDQINVHQTYTLARNYNIVKTFKIYGRNIFKSYPYQTYQEGRLFRCGLYGISRIEKSVIS